MYETLAQTPVEALIMVMVSLRCSSVN